MNIPAPKREDGRPLWRVIYDEVVSLLDDNKLSVGDILPHDQLRALLRDDEKGYYYMAIGRASRELMAERSRVLASVRGTGYQLTAGMGQVEVGDLRKKKASKELKRALKVYQTSDRGLMSPSQMVIADKKQGATLFLVGVAAMHEDRINALAGDVAHLHSVQRKESEKSSDTADRVSKLEEEFQKWQEAQGKKTA